MLNKVKRRIFSGCVLEQEVYPIAANRLHISDAEPIARFKDEDERVKHREGISRRYHIQLFNSNFSPQSLYSTLTMDNEHEVHTFEDAKRIGTLLMRCLKYANPDAQIMLYMGRGKNTDRIHFHMVSNGLDEGTIRAKWKAGKVTRITNLRAHNYYNGVDHGQDYTGLANYLFEHWTPEQGGKRWRSTRNLQRVKSEDAIPIKRNYSESRPPVAPKGYKFVEYKSNKFGYQYFKYVKVKELKPKHMKN